MRVGREREIENEIGIERERERETKGERGGRGEGIRGIFGMMPEYDCGGQSSAPIFELDL